MNTIKTLLLLAIFSSCAIYNPNWSPRPDSNYQFSVLQGATDDTSTTLRIVYPNYLAPLYKVTDASGNNIKIFSRKEFKHPSYEFKSEHLIFKSLKVGTVYALSIGTPGGRWKDIRTFETLSNEGDTLKILVASCMNDQYNDIGNQIWPKAFANNPDVSFLIGDNLYADIYSGIYIGANIPSTPAHLWKRHVDHAMTMKLYRMKRLVPTFVTWDDHDYGLNDGDKSYKHRKEAADIFKAFFPITKNKYLTPSLGVSSHLKLRGQNFFFLDGRSFRDSRENKKGGHLGMAQRSWLHKSLQKTTGLNWLIMGDQFFGGYHSFESFEGLHPIQFNAFKNELKKLNKRYVFLSGDRHLVEAMKISKEEVGRTSMEYTISGMHTKTYKGALKRDPNPRRIGGFDGQENYGIFTTREFDNDQTSITLKAYSISGEKLSHEYVSK